MNARDATQHNDGPTLRMPARFTRARATGLSMSERPTGPPSRAYALPRPRHQHRSPFLHFPFASADLSFTGLLGIAHLADCKQLTELDVKRLCDKVGPFIPSVHNAAQTSPTSSLYPIFSLPLAVLSPFRSCPPFTLRSLIVLSLARSSRFSLLSIHRASGSRNLGRRVKRSARQVPGHGLR